MVLAVASLPVGAEGEKAASAAAETAVVVKKEPAGIVKPILMGDDRGADDAPEGLDEQVDSRTKRVMPTDENYDPDTGLLDAVPSDRAGYLE